MRTYIFATYNDHKADEIRSILKAMGKNDICVRSIRDIESQLGVKYAEPEETGASFYENAFIKAMSLYVFMNINGYESDPDTYILADDSGLCVDALNGMPGIHSARYAGVEGKHASDKENIDKMLCDMEGIKDRRAHYECDMAAICLNGQRYDAAGIFNGSIALNIEGNGGFGYDPIFIPDGLNVSVAMLSKETKNSMSHRYKAIREIIRQIELG